ncbi:hypothetical protein E5D57_006694 [Metarhizium anisopliae]|nr:hypothetical protein E5D57_006694 [Metarhizium anisopliae]
MENLESHSKAPAVPGAGLPLPPWTIVAVVMAMVARRRGEQYNVRVAAVANKTTTAFRED